MFLIKKNRNIKNPSERKTRSINRFFQEPLNVLIPIPNKNVYVESVLVSYMYM